jgi:hypothetical protein
LSPLDDTPKDSIDPREINLDVIAHRTDTWGYDFEKLLARRENRILTVQRFTNLYNVIIIFVFHGTSL